MIKLYAGDTAVFEIDLIDADTQTPVDGSSVAKVWIRVGTDEYTETSSGVAVLATSIRLTLTAAQTEAYRKSLLVIAKVRTTGGEVSTIANESVEFLRTSLTPTY